MQIKVIVTGSTKWDRFIGRWGVSFLIGEDILFDTFGEPYTFLNNIQKMNIDIPKIKHIIISHDDWDHISGLWYIINRYKDLNVYICPNFKQRIKDRIESFRVNIIEANGLLGIKGDIFSTGQMDGKSEGRIISEQSLVIKTTDGLIVITGCAHPGIINIVENVKKQFKENIHLVLGGLHLKGYTEEQIYELTSKLRNYRVNKIAPSHCTGELAIKLIKKEYNNNFIQMKQGSIIEI